jgi:hypothetical protein
MDKGILYPMCFQLSNGLIISILNSMIKGGLGISLFLLFIIYCCEKNVNY